MVVQGSRRVTLNVSPVVLAREGDGAGGRRGRRGFGLETDKEWSAFACQLVTRLAAAASARGGGAQSPPETLFDTHGVLL